MPRFNKLKRLHHLKLLPKKQPEEIIDTDEEFGEMIDTDEEFEEIIDTDEELVKKEINIMGDFGEIRELKRMLRDCMERGEIDKIRYREQVELIDDWKEHIELLDEDIKDLQNSNAEMMKENKELKREVSQLKAITIRLKKRLEIRKRDKT
jgi:rRNA processing protein Krr1/Pno1